MNILIVTQQIIPHQGGLSTHIEALIHGLTIAGHKVRLIHGGMVQSPKIIKLLRLIISGGTKDRTTARNFRAMLKNLQDKVQNEINVFRPDIIHCHDVYAASAVCHAAPDRIDSIIETVHGPALYEAQMGGVDLKPRFKEIIMNCEKEAFANVKRFIAVDSGQRNILANDYGVDVNKIDVIYNCVDVDEIRTMSANKPSRSLPDQFFLVPRRLVEKTGVRYSIEAMAKLKSKAAQLLIAGPGPLREDLEILRDQLGLSDRVHFLGGVDRNELLPLFSRARGVLIPSVPVCGVVEATSLAVTEAMATGSIPIASNIGGLAELIDDKITGLLVPPADPSALAMAMDLILDDSEYRNKLILNATEKAENDYSLKSWTEKTLNNYQRILNN